MLYQHINEIIKINEKEFEEISSYFKPIHRKKHQFIIQSDYKVNHEYFVVKGCLKSYVTDEQGKEYVIQFATENWWITDYHAFLHRQKAKMDIDCLEDCQLLTISFEDKMKLCSENHKMEHFWATKSRYGYAALQNRILGFIRDPAKVRYENLIQQYPNLIQRVPKKYIASFLGVSRETLSRLYS